MTDTPHVFPTLIPGPDEDEPVDPYDIIEMSLPDETLEMLRNQGFTVRDVLDHKVPGLDPDEIIAEALRDCGNDRD